MDLYFLGTGAGMPSKDRNVTSIALRLYEERGTFWMFDCGEGTQHQILNSSLKLSKLEAVFITHLHGDHIFGLPGLLTSRSNQGGDSLLTLYGPVGLKDFINYSLAISQSHLGYEIKIVEIEEGVVFSDDLFEVQAAEVDHRITSFGYRIRERNRPGRLNEAKLKEQGVPPGPLYGRLKRGEDVSLDDGRMLRSSDYVGAPIAGRTIVIMGDTRRCQAAVELSLHADVLVHEATFGSDLEPLAEMYFHSTTAGAATLAVEANVRKLILTHISSRYSQDKGTGLLEEARRIFPHTELAYDHGCFSIPDYVME